MARCRPVSQANSWASLDTIARSHGVRHAVPRLIAWLAAPTHRLGEPSPPPRGNTVFDRSRSSRRRRAGARTGRPRFVRT